MNLKFVFFLYNLFYVLYKIQKNEGFCGKVFKNRLQLWNANKTS